ncbi:hypothetical protein GSF08_06410 [Clostridiaceae bacterium DONG20-135]|uniref:Dockerin domain-containing protein n=1 Tax=Copranaerobaculum intestinale TaxID=2692629 RepID=A0A6N8U7Q4_9FIRM|nr:GH25 family lysozyme [Copranaerobaculum intestinale]MXQ73565.1 hypothetical protein [Copranaerobaculum intestinale]
MKKLLCIIFVGAICIMNQSSVHAEDSGKSTGLFDDVEIVTDENAVPIDRKDISGMKNAEMGDTVAALDHTMQRSAAAPYWTNTGGVKRFYDANGNMMYHAGSKMIIDVSEHQGVINWDQVKAAGIDGAILRISYGYENGYDKQFVRNVQECNRLGIPYGIYMYSYAYDANFAYHEAADVVNLLSKVQVNLSYPIYYDIEGFDPFYHLGVVRYHPTSPSQYESIIATFINYMNTHGYAGKVHVYSYRNYLQNALNSSKILSYVSWIAAYTQTLGYTNTFYNGVQGWQYTNSGSVKGINGRVDISCFSDFMYNASVSASVPEAVTEKLAEKNIKFNAGYLTGFQLNSDISALQSSLAGLGKVTLYGINGNVITSGIVATGQTITIEMNSRAADQVYKMAVVIRGDVNGDGKISGIDYVKVRNKIDGKSQFNSIESLASDINNDGKISGIDYVRIRNHIDGKTTITQ